MKKTNLKNYKKVNTDCENIKSKNKSNSDNKSNNTKNLES